MEEKKTLAALKEAFPHTLPILAGFIVLGMGYGIYLRSSGLPLWYPTVTSILVFGGSLEFLLVSMLLAPFQPISVFFLSLLVQIRHLFYGLTLLKKYRGRGLKSLYLIYSMCDETFSVNCSTEVPEGVDEGWFMFFVSLLNQSYWVISVTLGSLLGGALTKYSEGVEFVMTAMFVVIFLEQWLKDEDHTSALLGIVLSVLCLLLFGTDYFILPAMAAILLALTLLRGKLEKKTLEGERM